jgi:hypothetical protein
MLNVTLALAATFAKLGPVRIPSAYVDDRPIVSIC